MLSSSCFVSSQGSIPLAKWEDEIMPVYQNSQNQHKKYNAKTDRPLPQSAKTVCQLELFATVPDHYQFVENLLKQLPRQRQREHFRKLYLKEYHSVADDGSIAFACGNLQTKRANAFLRDILGYRLRKVLEQYKCNVSFLQSFNTEPNWVQDINLEAKYQLNLVTVPTREEYTLLKQELEKIPSYVQHYFKVERQKASLPFYLITESKLKEIAYQIAMLLSKQQYDFITQLASQDRSFSSAELAEITLNIYAKCGRACEMIGFPIPHWAKYCANKKIKGELIDIALSKVACEKYWFRTMRKVQKQMVEHISIACGEVRKQTSMYISHNGLRDYRYQLKKNLNFLKTMIVENIDNPDEQAELLNMYLRSSSNPAIRRIEMMTRLDGIEKWADESGHKGLFITLTAPSAYHATLHNGENNPKWNGASPKETQAYLNQVWKQYRALLSKRKIKAYGMRVAEPHHDGTPHWHLLFYVPLEDKDEVIRLFKAKALEMDGNEKGAKKHRFKVEECDKSKGSATAYVAKYISKNMDGFALDDEVSDENPDLPLKENAMRAKGWSSLWGIRQFQFYGGASISVWRELRRLVAGQCDDDIIEEMRICADLGCYASYLKRQGGALAKRADQPVKLHYSEEEPNQYGEKRKKIDGIQLAQKAFEFIKTRLKKWVIKRKPKSDNQTNAVQSTAQTATNGRLGLVSVTVTEKSREDLKDKIQKALIPIRLPLNDYQIDYLISNKKLILNNYQRIDIKNGEVIINTNDTAQLHFADEPDYLKKLRHLVS
ncbi:replication endonuclease [Volucribacter psittacicida]|nr:replication endonuclease [Volucribacter psittacicida]